MIRLDELLVCPVCHGRLAGLTCSECGREYREECGALDLTPLPPPDPDVQNRWALWERLQANGEHAYTADPDLSLSVGERADAEAFARFAQLEGTVLDVGCGPQSLPSYARACPDRLVGIDPLVGRQPREFAFVKAIAEYLPFADGTFDRVLFATSLDHVLSSHRTLAEARRVTRAGGAAVVWIGEIVAPPSLADRGCNALRRLARGEVRAVVRDARAEWRRRAGPQTTYEVPDGAADAFHFSHPDADTVRSWLTAAGFAVEALERPLGYNCFIRARAA